MSKVNCFAYRPRYCTVLTQRICDKGKCSFFKTHKQHREDLKKYPPIDYALYKETGIRQEFGKRGR